MGVLGAEAVAIQESGAKGCLSHFVFKIFVLCLMFSLESKATWVPQFLLTTIKKIAQGTELAVGY